MPDDSAQHIRTDGKHLSVGAAPAWARLHLWQMQFVRDLLVLGMIVGIIYLGYLVRVVTIPMLLALLLAYLFEPLVQTLRRRKIASRRGAAIGIIAAVFLLIVVPVTLGAGFAAIQSVRAARTVADGVARVQASLAKPDDERLLNRVPDGAWKWTRDTLARADAARKRLTTPSAQSSTTGAIDAEAVPSDAAIAMEDSIPSDWEGALRLGLDWLRNHATEIGGTLGKRIVGGSAEAVGVAIATLTSIGFLVFSGVLTAFFFYFFSTGWQRVVDFAHSVIPDSGKSKTVELIARMDRVIAGFVRGRITICFVLMIVMTILYWLAGVPGAFVLGPLVGALFLVPFVHIVGVPIAMLLMWLDPLSGGVSTADCSAHFVFQRTWWWIVFAPIGIYMIAQFTDDWVLTPTIQGKTTDLSVPLILFASLAGGALAGVYGLLIAIPVAACLKIIVQEVLWPRFAAWVKGTEKDFLPISRG